MRPSNPAQRGAQWVALELSADELAFVGVPSVQMSARNLLVELNQVTGLGPDQLARNKVVNLAASPLRFEVDGAKLAPLLFEIEEAGQQAAIYHSHTHSEPYPSQTDVNFARWWPGCEWLIIGLENDGQPLARSFMISADGVIEELAVEIDG